MARGDWQTTSCDDCGAEIRYHVDWNRVPDLCSSCIAERKRAREEAQAKWHTTSCSDCRATIKYHDDWNRVPDLCPSCIAERKRAREEAQAKWRETACSRCGTTIKYNTDWNRIPDLCKPCIAVVKEEKAERERERAKWHTTQCSDCHVTITYHEEWNRIPDLCPRCIAERKRKREEAQAKWRETSCSRCRTTIKYNTDWGRIPDLCKPCIEKVKQEKAEREIARAKWHEKNCSHCRSIIRYHEDWNRVPDYCKDCNTWLTKSCEAQGCHDEIRYKIYWENIPEYCRSCKSGEKSLVERQDRPDGGWDEFTGWGYVNKHGTIVFVDDSPSGKHSHTVYGADGTLIGSRDEGYKEEWNNAERERSQKYVEKDEPRMAPSVEKGIDGEMMAEAVALNQFKFERAGYEPPLQNVEGIDQIFYDGNNIVIVEAKSASGYPPSALGKTQNGKQMSGQWVENHARKLANSTSKANKALGDDLVARLDSQKQASIRRIIINTDPRTGTTRAFEATNWNTDIWQELDPRDD